MRDLWAVVATIFTVLLASIVFQAGRHALGCMIALYVILGLVLGYDLWSLAIRGYQYWF